MEKNGKRVGLIFLSSLLATLALLYAGRGIKARVMESYAIASARASDGAKNLVVLNGISGYVGESKAYLRYLRDGYIKISGSNPEKASGWKELCKLELGPGTYTLTGMRGVEQDTVSLLVLLKGETDTERFIFQWDEDTVFTLDSTRTASVQVRVYPSTEGIDVIARPALYKENDDVAE